MQYVMLVAGSQPVDFSTKQFLYGNIFFLGWYHNCFHFSPCKKSTLSILNQKHVLFISQLYFCGVIFYEKLSIRWNQLHFKFHKKTRLKFFIFFSNNYQMSGRLFQKTQIVECFKIDHDYDRSDPQLNELCVWPLRWLLTYK